MKKLLSLSKIDEVTATGFNIHLGYHSVIDLRHLRRHWPLSWGWSWESSLYLSSPRWMITLSPGVCVGLVALATIGIHMMILKLAK